MECAAGRYGGETGLSDAACSGVCARGYWCAAGSVSAKAAACAEKLEARRKRRVASQARINEIEAKAQALRELVF